MHALLFLALLPSAPAPFPRAPQLFLPGKWDVCWNGVDCTMMFRPDGTYENEWCGHKYTGTWGATRDGTLRWTENCAALPGRWMSYSVKLDPATRRGTSYGVVIVLRRRLCPSGSK